MLIKPFNHLLFKYKSKTKEKKTYSKLVTFLFKNTLSQHKHRQAEELYLEKVKEKRCDLVEALLKISHIHMVKLNIDATNQHHQSALHLAIENEDRDMCTLLLQNEVTSNVYIILVVFNRLILLIANLIYFINIFL